MIYSLFVIFLVVGLCASRFPGRRTTKNPFYLSTGMGRHGRASGGGQQAIQGSHWAPLPVGAIQAPVFMKECGDFTFPLPPAGEARVGGSLCDLFTILTVFYTYRSRGSRLKGDLIRDSFCGMCTSAYSMSVDAVLLSSVRAQNSDVYRLKRCQDDT